MYAETTLYVLAILANYSSMEVVRIIIPAACTTIECQLLNVKLARHANFAQVLRTSKL
jgi:hypothetical protein